MSHPAAWLSGMEHRPTDRHLLHVAGGQHGVAHRATATAAGLTPRMVADRVDAGRLAWAAPSVLRVVGAPRTWQQEVMTAVLQADARAGASHRCAGVLLELDTFGDRARRIVELTVGLGRNLRSDRWTVHRSSDLLPCDIEVVQGIPTTTVARTLVDLGAVVPRSRLEHAVDGALRDDRTTVDELRALLARVRRRGRPGIAALDAVLTDRGLVAPASVLERMFLRLFTGSGLPAPSTQLRVERPDGKIAFVDAGYEDLRIGFEVDGHGTHATRAQRASDAARSNQLALAGWVVLRFTYEDVRDRSAAVITTIRRTLGSRVAS